LANPLYKLVFEADSTEMMRMVRSGVKAFKLKFILNNKYPIYQYPDFYSYYVNENADLTNYHVFPIQRTTYDSNEATYDDVYYLVADPKTDTPIGYVNKEHVNFNDDNEFKRFKWYLNFNYKKKVAFFLTNPENIKKLDKEKYELIKSELDKMTKDYKNEIGFDRFYQKKSIQTYTREYMTNREKDAYASAILGIKNPNQYQAEVLKNQYTSYKTTEKEIISNRRITIDKDLKTEQPEWADIVKYLGGYSELIKLGITKDDMPKFKIQKKLESIELTGKNTCLAHVIIEGDEKYGLKYYGIQKKNYTYNGSYEIISDNIDFSTIYGMAESTPNINITFKFAKHKHLPPIDMVVPLSSIGEEWGSKAIPYRDIMVQMINDMISDEEFVKIYSKEL